MAQLTLYFYTDSGMSRLIGTLSQTFSINLTTGKYTANITLPESTDPFLDGYTTNGDQKLVQFRDEITYMNYDLGGTFTYISDVDTNVSKRMIAQYVTVYQLSYNFNGGIEATNSNNISEYDSTKGRIYLSNPSLPAGYKFSGWYNDASYESPINYIDSDVILNANTINGKRVIYGWVHKSNKVGIYGRSLNVESELTGLESKYILVTDSVGADQNRVLTAVNTNKLVTDIINKQVSIEVTSGSEVNLDLSNGVSFEFNITLTNIETTTNNPFTIKFSKLPNKSAVVNIGSNNFKVIYFRVSDGIRVSEVRTINPCGKFLLKVDSNSSYSITDIYSPITESSINSFVKDVSRSIMPSTVVVDWIPNFNNTQEQTIILESITMDGRENIPQYVNVTFNESTPNPRSLLNLKKRLYFESLGITARCDTLEDLHPKITLCKVEDGCSINDIESRFDDSDYKSNIPIRITYVL